MRVVWVIILTLAGAYLAWETAKQLYTAAMEDYILTGRSMNRRVYRDENRALFRNNVIASILVFAISAGGFVMFGIAALDKLEL